MEQKTYKAIRTALIDNYKTALTKVYQENIFNLKLQKQENVNLEIINKEIYFITNETISKYFDC
jgi:hypothetical protein